MKQLSTILAYSLLPALTISQGTGDVCHSSVGVSIIPLIFFDQPKREYCNDFRLCDSTASAKPRLGVQKIMVWPVQATAQMPQMMLNAAGNRIARMRLDSANTPMSSIALLTWVVLMRGLYLLLF